MPRIQLPEDPKDKYAAFKKELVVPDPSRVKKNPNSIQELISAETLKNIMECRMKLVLQKELNKKMPSYSEVYKNFMQDIEARILFGSAEVEEKRQKMFDLVVGDTAKQYPLSKREADQNRSFTAFSEDNQ